MTPLPNSNFIIVGAGSAGCLLANRLSANPDHRVLLIEAGGADDWFWISARRLPVHTIANPGPTGVSPPKRTRVSRVAPSTTRGRVIGGCSSINAMIHMRGQASDYDPWAKAAGDERWRWGGPELPGETLAIYKDLEDYFGGADEWHGVGGEIRVERPRVAGKFWTPGRPPRPSWASRRSTSSTEATTPAAPYFHVNQRRGRRWSMADAFCIPSPTDPTSPCTRRHRRCGY